MSSLINGTAMPELGATNTMIGRKLGIYEIREELGKGGMGAVYKAYDTSLDRFVALKILPAMLALDRTLVERFQHEARAIAKVRHPNLVHIYGVGEEEGLNYFAMEYIEGKSLADAIRKRQRLASRVAISVLGQVMAGLNKVHQLNMVHRDIKPANIMIDRDGRAVLMDFGLAKGDERGLTTEGTIIGTPEYMSPEQAQGEETDGRSDIYALGIVLYEALAGQPPFTGKSAITILRQHVEDSPKPLSSFGADVPPEVEKILQKMLAKKREQRYQSLAELAVDLAPIHRTSSLSGLVSEAKRRGLVPGPPTAVVTAPTAPSVPVPDRTVELATRFREYGKWVAIGAAAALVIVAALGVIAAIVQHERRKPQKPIPLVRERWESGKVEPLRLTKDPEAQIVTAQGTFVARIRSFDQGVFKFVQDSGETLTVRFGDMKQMSFVGH